MLSLSRGTDTVWLLTPCAKVSPLVSISKDSPSVSMSKLLGFCTRSCSVKICSIMPMLLTCMSAIDTFNRGGGGPFGAQPHNSSDRRMAMDNLVRISNSEWQERCARPGCQDSRKWDTSGERQSHQRLQTLGWTRAGLSSVPSPTLA